MPQGYLAIILHAHLPYVRHPEHSYFLEENWLYEAITETYIPLIEVLERLADDGVPFRMAMSITPTLMSMFDDPLLQERYLHHLNKLIDLAEHEVARTRWQPEFHRLANMYRDRFYRARTLFEDRYHRNILQAFVNLQNRGVLEIMASAATHGYLPLMDISQPAVSAQIKLGVDTYKRFVGTQPKGFWLPECAYHPGHDRFLREAGITYFIVDAHGIICASPRPKYANMAPIYCPSGVAAFGRDLESSKQVWSATEGYPGDYDYREFYRDVGFDLEYDYIRPYIQPDGNRIFTGVKYYRITGQTHDKQPYDPDRAREKAAIHAGNFMFNREKQVEYLASVMDRAPLVIAPYDAELFGHWWFEGPMWLDFLFRKLAYDQQAVKAITPGDYLGIYPRNQLSTPSMSSWGYKGYNEVWLEGSNDWIYRHLHKAAERMVEIADTHPQATGVTLRAIRQAARELLLAQSSDWAFIMKTGTMVSYAQKRTKDHIGRFTRLYEMIKKGAIEEDWLREIEYADNIFPDLDYTAYRSDAAARVLQGLPASAPSPAGTLSAAGR
ncbi:MAG: glycoside hydrolase family 57 protein [Syntrophothermus sp.]